jgi:predicted enzyme related to lactoylglutathione lyase
MGFKVTWGMEGWSYASFDVGRIRLSLFKRELMAKDLGTIDLPSDVKCQDRVAFIFGVRNLDIEVKRLEHLGVELVAQPAEYPDYGIRSAHLRDPDGNLIEIYSQLTKRKWTEDLRKKDELFLRK